MGIYNNIISKKFFRAYNFNQCQHKLLSNKSDGDFYSYKRRLLIENLIEKFEKIEDVLTDTSLLDVNNEIKKQEYKEYIEDKIISIAKEFPDTFQMQKKVQTPNSTALKKEYKLISLAQIAFENGFTKIVKHALKTKNLACITDEQGRNISMFCADNLRPDLAVDSLTIKNAITQQDNNGNTLGMHLIMNCIPEDVIMQKVTKEAILSILEIANCSTQINNDGNNMGILCAERLDKVNYLIPCFEKATKDEIAIKQKNNQNLRMSDIALQHSYSVEQLSKLGLTPEEDQMHKFKETINARLEFQPMPDIRATYEDFFPNK